MVDNNRENVIFARVQCVSRGPSKLGRKNKGRNIIQAVKPDLPAIAGGEPIRPADRFIIFGAPVIGPPEIDAVVDCMRRRWIGSGPKVHEFEEKFARYKNIPHAVAMNSGTASIHIALLALGIGPGDEVITTPMTFCATVNAVIHTGATPVLVDCRRDSFNIDPAQIEAKISPRTRAILVVHMCGRCCDMDAILAISRQHGLFVVEDCAHAVESLYHSVPAGTLGDIGCFSFYATKNITTAEGGMLITRDAEVAKKARYLSNHGLSLDAWHRFGPRAGQHYDVVAAGFKYNMPDITAAIGIAQMDRLEAHAADRQRIWRLYHEKLIDLPCHLPMEPEPDTRHAYHLMTILLDLEKLKVGRADIGAAIRSEGVGVGVHYQAVHTYSYYAKRFGIQPEGYPNANDIGKRTLSLPLAADLTDADVDDICRAVSRVLRYYLKN